MLYIILILGNMAIIWGFNYGFGHEYHTWYYYALAVIIFTVSVIALDGIIAFIVRWCLPKKWFDKEFKVSKKEIRFYEKLKIKAWKDLVPELGGFTSFHKNKVENPNDVEYLKRFILEVNYGSVIHGLSFLSYLIIFIDYKMFTGSMIWLTIGVPVATVNFILHGLPTFVLRYNLPRLQSMYKFNLRKQQRNQKVEH